MIENKDIAPGAVTEPKLSKNLRLKLANLEKGQSAQLPIVQSDGSMAYKAIGGDATLADDGTLTVTTTTTTTGETVQGPAGPAGVAGPAGATGTQGATGPAGSDASVTAENVDGALSFTGSTAGFVKRTGDNSFDIDTTVYESAFSKNTAFNKNFGIAAGTVCQGNDGRLADSRTPTAHKSTHATGGTDAIAPSDIGAATSGHNHDTAYLGITAKAADSDKLDGNDSSAFAAASHNHDDRYYTETETNTLLAAKAASTHNHNSTYLGITAQAADSDMLDGLHGGDFAAADHGHTAADVTDGTFANARISAASVTQHQASIDHDALTNFVANEHIDWTADQGTTNIHTGNYNNTEYTAGSGLSLVGTEFSYDNSVIASQVNLSDGLALYTPLSTYQGHGHGQYAVKANNLSDLTNTGTARTNLGLGTAAQSATGDFATSGHTHSTGNNGFVPTAGSSGQFLAHNGQFATPPDTNTQLSTEEVQDIVGNMFTGNTETNITATYQDDDGTIDLVAATGSGSGTVSSSSVTSGTTDGNLAIYTGTTTVKQAPGLFYNGSDHQVTINETSSSSSNNSKLYVNGNVEATGYLAKDDATYYFKPADTGTSLKAAGKIEGAEFRGEYYQLDGASAPSAISSVGQLYAYDDTNAALYYLDGGGTSHALHSASDYRLKENIANYDLASAVSLIKSATVKTFDFKEGKSPEELAKNRVGFMAHELQEAGCLFGGVVSGVKDETLANGNDKVQSVNYGNLVPVIWAALQNAIARIEELETA